MTTATETHVCPQCGEEKPLTEEHWFRSGQAKTTGVVWFRKSACRDCYPALTWSQQSENSKEHQRRVSRARYRVDSQLRERRKRAPRARSRALSDLAKRYPDEYRELYEHHLATGDET